MVGSVCMYRSFIEWQCSIPVKSLGSFGPVSLPTCSVTLGKLLSVPPFSHL